MIDGNLEYDSGCWLDKILWQFVGTLCLLATLYFHII